MRRPEGGWAAAAGRLAMAIPQRRLHASVLAWSEARPPSEGWGAAFSGGADSLALLLLLWAHWPHRRARLRAFHFDHRLRGAESRADSSFCEGVCSALGVPLVVGSWERRGGPTDEASAREARLGFLHRESGRRRIRSLWFGHQQDDVAESLLMRLARGSGLGGLAAPRPVQSMPEGRTHLRPLMPIKKAELMEALAEAGIPWREDSSNGAGTYFRNRLRMNVIPKWIAASGRDAVAGAALSRERIEEDDTALEAWVDRTFALEKDGSLALPPLVGLPKAVLRRALHRWLVEQPDAGRLSRAGFEILLDSIERGTPQRQSLGPLGFAVIRKRRLRFERLRG